MSGSEGVYDIRIVRSAEREMRALPAEVFRKASEAMHRLAEEPRPHGSKKLKARTDYRLRIGSYRILYVIDDQARSVTVMAVRHRKDAYRR